MGFKVGTAIPIGYYHGQSGQTINARIEDESGGVFGAELTLVENAAFVVAGITGYYESSFTPDTAGRWTALIYSTTVKYGQMFYDVAVSKAEETQVLEVSITDPANNGLTTVATVTAQPCEVEAVIIHADTAQTANMTTCAVEGGTGQVVTFIGVVDAVQANLDAADKQVSWSGRTRFGVGELITVDLQGTGAAAVDLTITLVYRACVDGGYLV